MSAAERERDELRGELWAARKEAETYRTALVEIVALAYGDNGLPRRLRQDMLAACDVARGALGEHLTADRVSDLMIAALNKRKAGEDAH